MVQDNKPTDFFIWMVEQPDLTPAQELNTKQEKGRFVFETLRKVARKSQKEVRSELEQKNIKYRPYYISNKILVRRGSRISANLSP